ncbi:MAG: hypothetical protein GEU75_14180 [Dehalococcoidia bacterium]|nr:hypothetical protein [Dehalococcoidia bacterium]
MNEQDVWSGWGSVVMGLGAIVTFMMVVGILVWQVFKTWQASMETRAAIARDHAYQTLAEEAATAQKQIAEQQQRIATELATMRDRVAGIEKVLQQVD